MVISFLANDIDYNTVLLRVGFKVVISCSPLVEAEDKLTQ